MKDGYCWLTANIMFQAPWHKLNFDREALKSDLEEIDAIQVEKVEVVNRNLAAFWKEADIWFNGLDESLSENDYRNKILDKLTSPNRARESVRAFKMGPTGSIPVGEVPEDVFGENEIPWVAIGSTILAVTFLVSLFNLAKS